LINGRLTDTDSLARGISSALAVTGNGGSRVAVLARETNLYASTFPMEIVTCRTNGGQPLRLLCKYSSRDDAPFAPRRGPAHEALVYRHLLRGSPLTTVRFFGTYDEPEHGDTWLFLEYLDHGRRLTKFSPLFVAMERAATWIGRFHAEQERALIAADMSFLTAYDERHYLLEWARKTTRVPYASSPWFPQLRGRYEQLAGWLASGPRTVIHGEFYPKNILFSAGSVYPVDWESAALAVGEIDLASLVEGWDGERTAVALEAYRRARWQNRAPESFPRILDAARVYWQLLWLEQGDIYEWRFKELRAAGERLGLI
jgi:Phosphotransferase enzyme family